MSLRNVQPTHRKNEPRLLENLEKRFLIKEFFIS